MHNNRAVNHFFDSGAAPEVPLPPPPANEERVLLVGDDSDEDSEDDVIGEGFSLFYGNSARARTSPPIPHIDIDDEDNMYNGKRSLLLLYSLLFF